MGALRPEGTAEGTKPHRPAASGFLALGEIHARLYAALLEVLGERMRIPLKRNQHGRDVRRDPGGIARIAARDLVDGRSVSRTCRRQRLVKRQRTPPHNAPAEPLASCKGSVSPPGFGWTQPGLQGTGRLSQSTSSVSSP
jgi:hypothetical protein